MAYVQVIIIVRVILVAVQEVVAEVVLAAVLAEALRQVVVLIVLRQHILVIVTQYLHIPVIMVIAVHKLEVFIGQMLQHLAPTQFLLDIISKQIYILAK